MFFLVVYFYFFYFFNDKNNFQHFRFPFIYKYSVCVGMILEFVGLVGSNKIKIMFVEKEFFCVITCQLTNQFMCLLGPKVLHRNGIVGRGNFARFAEKQI